MMKPHVISSKKDNKTGLFAVIIAPMDITVYIDSESLWDSMRVLQQVLDAAYDAGAEHIKSQPPESAETSKRACK